MKEIPLTRGAVALVDDADFELLNQFKWYCAQTQDGRRYAVRTDWTGAKQATIKMHRFLTRGAGPHTDHRDGNGLNNQRDNLRPCSPVENGRNRKIQLHSSRFKGVSRRGCKWEAYLRCQQKKIHLGTFNSEAAAAEAYDARVTVLYGEFARTNKQMGAL